MMTFDYFMPTSEMVKTTIEELGISQSELAKRMGMSEKHISQFMNNKIKLTPDMAYNLGRVIGISPEHLLKYEAKYRIFLKQQEELEAISKEDIDKIYKDCEIKFLVDEGWITPEENADKAKKIQHLLDFIGAKDLNSFIENYTGKIEHSYSFKEDGYKLEPLLLWLKKCEYDSTQQRVAKYNKENFEKQIKEIRKLVLIKDESVFEKVKEICNKSGVYFVMEKAVPSSKVRGATTWIKDNPAIFISLRFKTNDHFWFALFHEIGHILLHENKKDYIDYEVAKKDVEEINIKEKEADEFARNILIPDEKYNEFINSTPLNKENIIEFSKSVKVDPAIVLGRLQHDKKIKWNQFNELKYNYNFV